jgi:hypothetical protein
MKIASFFSRAVHALDAHFDGVRRYETVRLYGARRELWNAVPVLRQNDQDK